MSLLPISATCIAVSPPGMRNSGVCLFERIPKRIISIQCNIRYGIIIINTYKQSPACLCDGSSHGLRRCSDNTSKVCLPYEGSITISARYFKESKQILSKTSKPLTGVAAGSVGMEAASPFVCGPCIEPDDF